MIDYRKFQNRISWPLFCTMLRDFSRVRKKRDPEERDEKVYALWCGWESAYPEQKFNKIHAAFCHASFGSSRGVRFSQPPKCIIFDVLGITNVGRTWTADIGRLLYWLKQCKKSIFDQISHDFLRILHQQSLNFHFHLKYLPGRQQKSWYLLTHSVWWESE